MLSEEREVQVLLGARIDPIDRCVCAVEVANGCLDFQSPEARLYG